MASATHADPLHLPPVEGIPNNPRLPVLLYHGDWGDEWMVRERLAANGWRPEWTGSVYDFHHFHSTAHEFLAVIAGRGELLLGGPTGHRIGLHTGDAVLLPAGTGHRLDWSDDGFRVLAGYPEGQHWDLLRPGEGGPDLAATIAAVGLPHSDPLDGADGPLLRHWTDAG